MSVGEEVWVKPPDAKCTRQWNKGTITGITSENNISVDGIPRHWLDIRRVVLESTQGDTNKDGGEVDHTELLGLMIMLVGKH